MMGLKREAGVLELFSLSIWTFRVKGPGHSG
jgi:hypothetical protein